MDIRSFLSFYFRQEERLAPRLTRISAVFGGLGYPAFYLLLTLWSPSFWENLWLRLAAALAMASLWLLPRQGTWSLRHKVQFDAVYTLCMPVFFTAFMFQNQVNLYWSFSILFAAIPYGLIVNPPRAIVLYPLSAGLTVLLGAPLWRSEPNFWLGVLFLIPSYFLVVILGCVHTVIQYAEAKAERERSRSEALLRNILPEPIAERLKTVPGVIADQIPSCTILFADIVGFTRMSNALAPVEIVSLLDRLFSRFDRLAGELGLEKIKTIGDAYMLAGGVPDPRPDHASAMVQAAQGMQAIVHDFNASQGTQLQLRIGLHSGPLVAGVIGSRKFSYDVWGATVNTAKSMEASCEPGRIQLSDDTAKLLAGAFPLAARGIVALKGGREIQAWFLDNPVHG